MNQLLISHRPRGLKQSLVALTLIGLLGACGGGGGGGGGGTGSAAPPSSTSSAQQITGTDAQRLAEQAAFGPTNELVAQISAQGSAWIDAQISTPATGYPPIAAITNDSAVYCPATLPAGNTCYRDNYEAFPLQLWFFQNAINGPDQLRQRVALAYSQIFVISAETINSTYGLRNYHQMLLNDAFANFRQIIEDVTLSPAMGTYLNMVNNNKGNPAAGITPNENFGREVLQLFTVGPNMLNPDGTLVLKSGLPVPTYSQDVVEGFSSIFTGWTYPNAAGDTSLSQDNYTTWYAGKMIPVASQHDEGTKLLLSGVTQPASQSIQADLKAGLDNIFNHPNVGPFIGKQMIKFLVTSNPSNAYVSRITAVFNNDGTGTRGNMAAVIKAILLDPEARGAVVTDPAFGKLREPVVDVAAVMRALGAKTDGEYPASMASQLGENVFTANSVFNFYSPTYALPGSNSLVAPQFGLLNTSSSLTRMNFINSVVYATNGVVSNPDTTLTTTTAIGTTISLAGYESLALTPGKMIEEFNANLLHSTLSSAEYNAIVTATTAFPANDATLTLDRTRAAAYLILASPRYQVTR